MFWYRGYALLLAAMVNAVVHKYRLLPQGPQMVKSSVSNHSVEEGNVTHRSSASQHRERADN
jgi:hypothetical protein